MRFRCTWLYALALVRAEAADCLQENRCADKCPLGVLPDDILPNTPSWNKGLCSPTHGNRAYFGIAGGGHRAMHWATGLFAGMYEEDPSGQSAKVWPDNMGANSGGSWATTQLWNYGPDALFNSRSGPGRYVQPAEFKEHFDNIKGKGGGKPVFQSGIVDSLDPAVASLLKATLSAGSRFSFINTWYQWIKSYYVADDALENGRCPWLNPSQVIRSYPMIVAAASTSSWSSGSDEYFQVLYTPDKVAYRHNGGKGFVVDSSTFQFMDPESTAAQTTVNHMAPGVDWCSAASRSSNAYAQGMAGAYSKSRMSLFPDLRYQDKGKASTLNTMDGAAVDNAALYPAFAMRATRIVHTAMSGIPMIPKGKNGEGAEHWTIYEYAKACMEYWPKLPWKDRDYNKYYEGKDCTSDEWPKLFNKLYLKADDASYFAFDIWFASGQGDRLIAAEQGMGVFHPSIHCAMVNEWITGNSDNSEPLVTTIAATINPPDKAKKYWGMDIEKTEPYDVLYTFHQGQMVKSWADILSSQGLDIADACDKAGAFSDTVDASRIGRQQPFPHISTQQAIVPECIAALQNMAAYSYSKSKPHYDFSLDIDEFTSFVNQKNNNEEYPEFARYAHVIDCRDQTVTTSAQGYANCLHGKKPLNPNFSPAPVQPVAPSGECVAAAWDLRPSIISVMVAVVLSAI